MKNLLTKIEVFGLFGRYNLSVPVQDDRLVLVGENGSGKSTVVNALYYILTGQWERLESLPIQKAVVHLDGADEPITIEVDSSRGVRTRKGGLSRVIHTLSQQLPHPLVERLIDEISRLGHHASHPDWQEILSRYGLSYQISERILIELSQLQKNDRKAVRCSPDQNKIRKMIRERFSGQVLFLPTYRRIERDLQSIFPKLELDGSLRRFNQRASRDPQGFIELVEFGMTDVEQMVTQKLSSLDKNFRTSLNRLTGKILHDIINDSHKTVSVASLTSDEAVLTLDSILERIEDNVLPSEDRAKLKNLVTSLRRKDVATGTTVGPIGSNDHDPVVIYFLTKLLDIHEKQRAQEGNIRKLVDLCNGYLSEKRLIYDPSSFELYICRATRDGDVSSERIPWSGLSSGEKQIVSLFAHMFLSGFENFFVLIDEPELSISVPWQKRLLADLLDTGLCKGLLAVTHSPFIFENALRPYAQSIHQFLRASEPKALLSEAPETGTEQNGNSDASLAEQDQRQLFDIETTLDDARQSSKE